MSTGPRRSQRQMAQFSFPSRQLYGISIGVDAPFTPQLQETDPEESPEAEDTTSLQATLIGTWDLVTYYAPSVSDPDDVLYPLGSEAKGILMYCPDGYMSCTLLRPGQPSFSSGAESPGRASNIELAESARRYLGYSGPYFIDETGERSKIRHVMKLVNFPNWVGNVQTRVVELEGDRLTLALESIVEMGGILRNPLLVFKRAPKNNVILDTSPTGGDEMERD